MGPLLCLLSAAAFGAMGIFGKLAYDAEVPVGDLLLVRFAIAAAVLMAIALARGALRGLSRRAAATAFAMGAIGYATQSGLFFTALERMDASLLALVLYTYPALVCAGAIALGRERASVRRGAALVAATAGAVLVLAGAASGSLDALATVMGLGAATTYTVYILVGERALAGIAVLPLTALVCTGAATSFLAAALVRGGPELGFGAAGWGWVAAIALVSTVGAILLFFAGLARVGPSRAAILSVLEPVVTVGLAAAAFGESLAPVQFVGVGRLEIDYLSSLVLADLAVRVDFTVERVGTTSLTLGETMHAHDGRVVARSRSVPVLRDLAAGRSRPLTAEERAVAEALLP